MSLWEKYKLANTGFNKISGLSFELTDACNLNCTHCYRIRHTNFLDKTILFQALDEAEELGVITIGFNGGEPLLHSDFIEMATTVLKKGMVLSVLTNATLLNEETLKKLDTWKGIDFQISLYGHDAESSERITGDPNAFENTVKAVKLILKYGFKVDVAVLARNDEINHIPALVEMFQSMGITPFVNPMLVPRENGDKFPISLRSDSPQLEKVLKWENFEGSEAGIFSNEGCGAGITSLGITAKGEITPCLLIRNHILGFFPEISLKSALISEKLAEFKKLNVMPEQCKTCEISGYCSRCPATTFYEFNSFSAFNPEDCRIAELRKKIFNLQFEKLGYTIE